MSAGLQDAWHCLALAGMGEPKRKLLFLPGDRLPGHNFCPFLRETTLPAWKGQTFLPRTVQQGLAGGGCIASQVQSQLLRPPSWPQPRYRSAARDVRAVTEPGRRQGLMAPTTLPFSWDLAGGLRG